MQFFPIIHFFYKSSVDGMSGAVCVCLFMHTNFEVDSSVFIVFFKEHIDRVISLGFFSHFSCFCLENEPISVPAVSWTSNKEKRPEKTLPLQIGSHDKNETKNESERELISKGPKKMCREVPIKHDLFQFQLVKKRAQH